MQTFNLGNTFTEINSGTNGCILQVKRGVVAIHVGEGTPNVASCITFAAGEKWIVREGVRLRAASDTAPLAVVVVGTM